MTAITLNLLAEEQLAQEARARDPIKIFVAVGLLVLAAAVGSMSLISMAASQKKAVLVGLETQLSKMNALGDQGEELQKMRSFSEGIISLNNSRFLLAPHLALVKDIVPRSILLSRLGYTLQVDKPAPEPVSKEAGSVKKATSPKSAERMSLRMEGTAMSARPELEVDQFLSTLRNDARFSAMVDDIQLRAISRRAGESPEPVGNKLAADFIIECRFKGVGSK